MLHPKCVYLLVTRSGTQYKKLSDLMSILTFQTIGKYIHLTRYCQIVETESALRLSSEEQSLVSRDQKHSSQVARTDIKNWHFECRFQGSSWCGKIKG